MRRIVKVAVSIALAVTAVVTVASPASADLWGPTASTSPPDTKWGQATSNVLGYGYITNANIVGLWQGYLQSVGQLPCNGINGAFGSATYTGTKNLQTFWGITADGIVGNQTWSTASQWTQYVAPDYNNQRTFKNLFVASPTTLFHQQKSGVFQGYWHWSSINVSPYASDINTSATTVTFSPNC